jgi:hypothetical protein
MLFATFKRWLRRRWPSTADAVAAEQLACARMCATLWEYRESFADECAVAIMRRHNRRKHMTSEEEHKAAIEMNDRELLERAAKAAGLRLTWGDKYRLGDDEIDCTDLPYALSDGPDESPFYWNPLTDDGDALRLAVKLHLWEPVMFGRRTEVAPDGDIYAATRRAIVRAAAAMAAGGKA